MLTLICANAFIGTWQAPPGEVENAVATALLEGYRHIDCALIYKNEAEVGEGIRRSGVPRDEIFITSKLWNTFHPNAVESLRRSLEDLGTGYLDLYVSTQSQAGTPGRGTRTAIEVAKMTPGHLPRPLFSWNAICDKAD